MMGARPAGASWQRPLGRAVYKLMNSSVIAPLKENLSFKRGLEKFRDAIEEDAASRERVDVETMRPSTDLVSEFTRRSRDSD